jgi:hypothetical protein
MMDHQIQPDRERGHVPLRSGTLWKCFSAREQFLIEAAMRNLQTPSCMRCTSLLTLRPASRLEGMLPPGASAFDLECRPCRRFHAVVEQDEESVNGERLRRLAMAVLGA